MDESATIVEHGLCNLGVMAHGEQIGGVSHQRIHVEYREGDAGQGSPSDPTMDTILMMIATAGNREKMNRASAWVAIMKSTVIPLSSNQLP